MELGEEEGEKKEENSGKLFTHHLFLIQTQVAIGRIADSEGNTRNPSSLLIAFAITYTPVLSHARGSCLLQRHFGSSTLFP